MSQAVIIKSNKYGLKLILDKEMEFEALLEAIAAKFRESEKFFQDAKVAVAFEGRELTKEQEFRIIETITGNSNLSIICILDNDAEYEEWVKSRIDTYYETIAGKSGEFYRGTLHAGQTLESSASLVVVGDVDPGAKVISQGNIVVLGSLKGNAYAGAAGDNRCFVAALDLEPAQLQIGDAAAKKPDRQPKPKRLRRKAKAPAAPEPKIAVVKGGDIYIEPILGNNLNSI